MKKQRGRKAGAGTLEARKFVNSGNLGKLLTVQKELSDEALVRIIKAVKFGLGIKETKTEEE